MSLAFLVFANAWLLARLICLFRDRAGARRIWLGKTLVELAALVVLYPAGAAWLGAALTVIVLNIAAHRHEQRPGRKDLGRLLLGGMGLAAWSFWFSPATGLALRPELAAWAARIEPWTAWAVLFESAGSRRIHLILFGLLLAANEANLLIRAVFDRLDLKPRVAEGGGGVDEGELNRGRVIGMLERILLYGFMLQAQFGAIGFVLAAKAFTRSKALENNRAFGEYVLIGTLLSASLALVIGGAVRWLLARA